MLADEKIPKKNAYISTPPLTYGSCDVISRICGRHSDAENFEIRVHQTILELELSTQSYVRE